MGVPTVIIARTDAEAARLLTSDIDKRDHPFITGERTTEGFFRITGGIDMCIARGLAKPKRKSGKQKSSKKLKETN